MDAVLLILGGFLAELSLTTTILFLFPKTSHYEQAIKLWYRICSANEDEPPQIRKNRVRNMMMVFAVASLALFLDLLRRYPAIDGSLKSSGIDSGFLILGLFFGWAIPFVIWLHKEGI